MGAQRKQGQIIVLYQVPGNLLPLSYQVPYWYQVPGTSSSRYQVPGTWYQVWIYLIQENCTIMTKFIAKRLAK